MKKDYRVIKCYRNAWLKLRIDMNTDLRKKAQNDFEKDFFKLMNKAVFGKTVWEDIEMQKQDKRTCYNKKKKKLLGVRIKLSFIIESFSQNIY